MNLARHNICIIFRMSVCMSVRDLTNPTRQKVVKQKVISKHLTKVRLWHCLYNWYCILWNVHMTDQWVLTFFTSLVMNGLGSHKFFLLRVPINPLCLGYITINTMYTNPARGILDFCKQKFYRLLLCSPWTLNYIYTPYFEVRILHNIPQILRSTLRTLNNTPRTLRNTPRTLRNTPRTLYKIHSCAESDDWIWNLTRNDKNRNEITKTVQTLKRPPLREGPNFLCQKGKVYDVFYFQCDIKLYTTFGSGFGIRLWCSPYCYV